MDVILAIVAIVITVIAARMYQKIVLEPIHKAELEALRFSMEAVSNKRVAQSRAVIWGQSSESFVPWLPGFHYSPPDVQHLGGTVDLIVFDGLTAGEVQEVVFMELKTGHAQLSTRQLQIRKAIEEGRVRFETFRVPEHEREE